VSVAWADGRVAEQEMEVIESLLQAFKANASEAREIRMFAKTPKTLEDISLTDLSYDDRRILLQHAVLLTFIDGEQDDQERRFLDELAERLEVRDAEARPLMAAAAERARGMLTLLQREQGVPAAQAEV
jgi:tellurite resistance protein